MSRLKVPEGTHIHAVDAAAHSLGASTVTSFFDDEDKDHLKLVEIETDTDIKQADFDKALSKHAKKVTARQDFLKGVAEITGTAIPVNVNATEAFVSALLEVILLSDDETKKKLVDHVKAYRDAQKV